MNVFVDTSAFYALVSETDEMHVEALAIHERLKEEEGSFVTTNYVFLESVSLLQKRYGVAEARRFGDFVDRQVELVWVDGAQHRRAWDYWKQRGMRHLSFVDCSCFIVMHNLSIRQAFTFDEQFRTAGFSVLAGPSDRVAERRATYRAGRISRQ